MSRLIVSEFVTLDGVAEDPGGAEGFQHGGWAFKFERGQEGDRFKLEETMQAESMLLGRKTYEGFAQAWPERTDEVGFADKMNEMPKYVVSSTLQEASWNNSTILSGGDAAEQVSELKQRSGGDILVAGSLQLVSALLQAELVDELRLMIFPTVLGSGKRLFEGVGLSALRLTDSRPAGETLICMYEPK